MKSVLNPALRRLWQHAGFRRLLLVRTLSQAADGALQVGMASYILFSPASQPTAWAIAGILALTLLPFTVIGPFVSTFLDRWSRRQVAIYSDAARAIVAAGIGLLIATGRTEGWWQVALYGALLIAMSINRFMLAALSAGMQHTVEPDEYLSASSILPTVGPLGVVIGALLGFAARFGLGPSLGANQADAVVFWVAAVLFVGSVLTALGFSRAGLGPAPGNQRTSFQAVLTGLSATFAHLRTRTPAALALGWMFITRLLFGTFSVAVILAMRNLFNTDPAKALADLTLWGSITGGGFIAAAAFVPLLVRWLGLRRCAISILLGLAVAQFVVAVVPQKWVLLGCSLVIGLGAQSFKICVDTLVQAHVDESFKGRAFVFYDVAFNTAFVLAGVLAALLLPSTGISTLGFTVISASYLGLAVGFAALARQIGAARFEQGTEDLTRTS